MIRQGIMKYEMNILLYYQRLFRFRWTSTLTFLTERNFKRINIPEEWLTATDLEKNGTRTTDQLAAHHRAYVCFPDTVPILFEAVECFSRTFFLLDLLHKPI